ncbi:hypothetical protein [Rhodanobacter sp. OR87]|uniref:hypothetical protein n=1 Tax=Rhodanobacter sp. OR87 TaxID=1076523 RepID=UPI0012DCFA0B|nr:hypothetical protein [Rhodanobacter sp. OR87]
MGAAADQGRGGQEHERGRQAHVWLSFAARPIKRMAGRDGMDVDAAQAGTRGSDRRRSCDDRRFERDKQRANPRGRPAGATDGCWSAPRPRRDRARSS